MSRIARNLLAVGLCLLAPAALAGGGGAPVTRPNTSTYTNPVLNENVPDPFVLKVGNTYYELLKISGLSNRLSRLSARRSQTRSVRKLQPPRHESISSPSVLRMHRTPRLYRLPSLSLVL